jgi:urea transport system ATP-binding protein
MVSETGFFLAVDGLTVSFDGPKAVGNLSLDVDARKIHVITGPNCAGRAPLLDLICGRTKATAGSVRFKIRELLEKKEHQIVHPDSSRKFQHPSIYEDLSVSRTRKPASRAAATSSMLRRSGATLSSAVGLNRLPKSCGHILAIEGGRVVHEHSRADVDGR